MDGLSDFAALVTGHLVGVQSRWDQLQEEAERLLDQRTAWVHANRKKLKQHFMPATGEYYRIRRFGPCPFRDEDYRWTFSLIEGAKLSDVQICRVTKSRLLASFSEANTRRDEFFPAVKVQCFNAEWQRLDVADTWHSSKIQAHHLCSVPIERPAKHADKPTFIYVMIDKNTGMYKVGRSVKPQFREKTLQSEKPTIELLFTHRGTHADERHLHAQFHTKRVRGEWCALDANDLAYIKDYMQPEQSSDETPGVKQEH